MSYKKKCITYAGLCGVKIMMVDGHLKQICYNGLS
jgi:hypothetical protein